jgi:tetratricopeptide (TPR) repeat protein
MKKDSGFRSAPLVLFIAALLAAAIPFSHSCASDPGVGKAVSVEFSSDEGPGRDERSISTGADIEVGRLKARTREVANMSPAVKRTGAFDTTEILLLKERVARLVEDGRDNPFSLVEAAVILERLGEREQAMLIWPEIERSSRLESASERLLFALGVVLEKAGKRTAAHLFFEQMKSRGAARGKTMFQFEAAELVREAVESRACGKGVEARFMLEESLRISPLSHAARFMLARVKLGEGRLVEAAGDLVKAIKAYALDPRNIEAICVLISLGAASLLFAGWIARLVVYLKSRKLIIHESRDNRLSFDELFVQYVKRAFEGRFYLHSGRFEVALIALSFVALYPVVGGAARAGLLYEVDCLMHGREFAPASLLLELDPGSLKTSTGMFLEAVLKERCGAESDALFIFKRLTPRMPLFEEAQNNIGVIEARSGEIVGALTRFEKLVLIAPEYDVAISNKAALEKIEGGGEKVDVQLTALVEADPALPDFFLVAFSMKEMRPWTLSFWLWFVLGFFSLHSHTRKRSARARTPQVLIFECVACGSLSCDLCRPSVDMCPRCGESISHKGQPRDGYGGRLLRRDRWRLLIFTLILPSFPIYLSGYWGAGFIATSAWVVLLLSYWPGLDLVFLSVGREIRALAFPVLKSYVLTAFLAFHIIVLITALYLFRRYLAQRSIDGFKSFYSPERR